jgi:hypothetical protein
VSCLSFSKYNFGRVVLTLIFFVFYFDLVFFLLLYFILLVSPSLSFFNPFALISLSFFLSIVFCFNFFVLLKLIYNFYCLHGIRWIFWNFSATDGWSQTYPITPSLCRTDLMQTKLRKRIYSIGSIWDYSISVFKRIETKEYIVELTSSCMDSQKIRKQQSDEFFFTEIGVQLIRIFLILSEN